MTDARIINPKEWPKPIGYSNGVVASGPMLYLGGQVAFDTKGEVVGEGDLVLQFEQVMKNLQTVCKAGGSSLKDVVKLTIFVQDRDDYKAKGRELGAVYRQYFGRHYPAMTLVEVARFYETKVLIEIEGIAVADRSCDND
ncbi:MAG: RidA family protein [Planctomycetota bacterium]